MCELDGGVQVSNVAPQPNLHNNQGRRNDLLMTLSYVRAGSEFDGYHLPQPGLVLRRVRMNVFRTSLPD